MMALGGRFGFKPSPNVIRLAPETVPARIVVNLVDPSSRDGAGHHGRALIHLHRAGVVEAGRRNPRQVRSTGSRRRAPGYPQCPVCSGSAACSPRRSCPALPTGDAPAAGRGVRGGAWRSGPVIACARRAGRRVGWG